MNDDDDDDDAALNFERKLSVKNYDFAYQI